VIIALCTHCQSINQHEREYNYTSWYHIRQRRLYDKHVSTSIWWWTSLLMNLFCFFSKSNEIKWLHARDIYTANENNDFYSGIYVREK